MSQANMNLSAASANKQKTKFVIGIAGLAMLCITSLLTPTIATSFAGESEQGTRAPGVVALPTDGTTLPLLNSIDAQTDITVFLRSGVPAELRVAALRRAWRVDPTIRDFKGLQENDWNFDDPNSAPGFGELGPEVDTKKMVAQIIGETPQVVARGSNRHGFEIVLRLLQRLNIADSAIARD